MYDIKDITFGYYPSAQLSGMKCLLFEFKETKDKVPEDNEKIKDVIENIFNKMKFIIEKKHLEEEWVNFLLAKRYGIFTGDEIANPVNARISQNLLAYIGHMSHDLQKEEPVEFRKRPPMMCYIGKPIYFTGNEQFYENFNIIIIDCDPHTDPMGFALIEMQNHTFSNLQAKCKTVEDVDNFIKKYIDMPDISISKDRRSIINIGNKDIIEKAFKEDLRVFVPLKGDFVLKI